MERKGVKWHKGNKNLLLFLLLPFCFLLVPPTGLERSEYMESWWWAGHGSQPLGHGEMRRGQRLILEGEIKNLQPRASHNLRKSRTVRHKWGQPYGIPVGESVECISTLLLWKTAPAANFTVCVEELRFWENNFHDLALSQARTLVMGGKGSRVQGLEPNPNHVEFEKGSISEKGIIDQENQQKAVSCNIKIFISNIFLTKK